MGTITYNPKNAENVSIPKFRIASYPYKIIQLIPYGKSKDTLNQEIINAIYSIRKPIKQQFGLNGTELTFHPTQPVTFEILYTNEKITFNFAVPEDVSEYFKGRLQSIFPRATITFIDDYINNFVGGYMYEYGYDKHYMCSLDTNKEKSPLKSLLAIKKDIQENEQVLLQVNMTPVSHSWKDTINELWNKIKQGEDPTGNTHWVIRTLDKFFGKVDNTLEFVDDILGIQVNKPTQAQRNMDSSKRVMENISSYSRQKPNHDGFKTEIKTYVKTDSVTSAYNHSKSIETGFKDMAGDNTLSMKSKEKIVTKEDILKRKTNRMKRNNIMSTMELTQFVRIPEETLQRAFGVSFTKSKQVSVPKEMSKGILLLGHLEKRGEMIPVYFPHIKNVICLPKVILTKMGGGKSSFLLNICDNIISHGEGLVLLDYIQDNKTANALKARHKKLTYLDISTTKIPIHFPEKAILPTDSPHKRKEKANAIAYEVEFLINTLGKEEFTTPMRKYVRSASKIAFIHKNAKLKDVMDIIENHVVRSKFIEDAITSNCFTEQSTEIVKLKELDVLDNKGNPIGTVSNKQTEGIASRFYVLQGDSVFEDMLDVDPDDTSINFVDIMDNQQQIALVLPQDYFTVSDVRDLFVTYFMSRIRLAMSTRKEPEKVCHIVIDEVHQVQGAMEMIGKTIGESRKFGVSYWFAMHSLDQFPPSLKSNITAYGTHFMLLKGIDKKGFESVSDYIDEDFSFEDITDMDYDFGSLNVFSINNKYQTFISRLPEALRDEKGELYIY